MAGESYTADQFDDALWQFAVGFYARDGVAAACLTLQEELGVDVNILMLAIFAQLQRGACMSQRDVAAVDALVRDWRTEVVQPLRRLRTRLKSGPPPAPCSTTERLRNRIKAAELDAERTQLQVMQGWLERSALHSSPAADAPRVIARYFAGGDAFLSQVDAALYALTKAMHG